VIGAAVEVHRALGPGLLESAYEQCFAHELTLQRIGFIRQQALPVSYKGLLLNHGYRLDFVVEQALVIEIKAVERLMPVHEAQLLTYLRLSVFRTGLLINFNAETLKRGLRRMTLK
jgi:GxxExxY protein